MLSLNMVDLYHRIHGHKETVGHSEEEAWDLGTPCSDEAISGGYSCRRIRTQIIMYGLFSTTLTGG